MTFKEIFLGIISPFFYWVRPDQRVFWGYLLTALILAGGVYLLCYRPRVKEAAKGFIHFCFPKEVYRHPSAIADYKYFVVNRIAFLFFLAPLVFASSVSAQVSESLLTVVFKTSGDFLSEAGWLGTIALTLAVILVQDFAFFFVHLLLHRVPLLWEFHKVHHSAEVLTPLTVYRMHPVDDICVGSFTGFSIGIVYGICSFTYAEPPGEITFFGLNAVLFAFYVLGFNLRHTHIWLPYTGWLGHILVSPAHHQIHHGASPDLYDRNLGFIFAFWDWAAGTLYVPKPYQEIDFGLTHGESKDYDTVWHMYTVPFMKAFGRITGSALGRGS